MHDCNMGFGTRRVLVGMILVGMVANILLMSCFYVDDKSNESERAIEFHSSLLSDHHPLAVPQTHPPTFRGLSSLPTTRTQEQQKPSQQERIENVTTPRSSRPYTALVVTRKMDLLWDLWWMNSFRLFPQSGNIHPTYVQFNDTDAILQEIHKSPYDLVLSTVKPTLLAAEVLQAASDHLPSPETARIVDDKVKLAQWMMGNGLQERVPHTVPWSQFVHNASYWIDMGGFPIIVKYPRGEGSSHVYICRDQKELDFLMNYFLDTESNKHVLDDNGTTTAMAFHEYLVQEYAGEPATYVDVYVRQGQMQAFKCYHYTQELIPTQDLSRDTNLQVSDLLIENNKRPMRTPWHFENVTCRDSQDLMWLAQRLAHGLKLKGAWGFHTAVSRRTGLNVVMDLNARIDAVQAGRFKEELGRWLREMLDTYSD